MKRALVATCALACACGAPNAECTDEAVAGITAYVIDSTSGDPICDATVTLVDGSYTETAREISPDSGNCYYAGAFERAGTYDVNVSAPNKNDVTDANVVVSQGACHVLPQTVTIEM